MDNDNIDINYRCKDCHRPAYLLGNVFYHTDIADGVFCEVWRDVKRDVTGESSVDNNKVYINIGAHERREDIERTLRAAERIADRFRGTVVVITFRAGVYPPFELGGMTVVGNDTIDGYQIMSHDLVMTISIDMATGRKTVLRGQGS